MISCPVDCKRRVARAAVTAARRSPTGPQRQSSSGIRKSCGQSSAWGAALRKTGPSLLRARWSPTPPPPAWPPQTASVTSLTTTGWAPTGCSDRSFPFPPRGGPLWVSWYPGAGPAGRGGPRGALIVHSRSGPARLGGDQQPASRHPQLDAPHCPRPPQGGSSCDTAP